MCYNTRYHRGVGSGRMEQAKAGRERILVCVSASPANVEVIRRAVALSNALRAGLIALYVENPDVSDGARLCTSTRTWLSAMAHGSPRSTATTRRRPLPNMPA